MYRKMETVVEKLNQMELREEQKERERITRSRDRSAKRYNSSMKAIEEIGKGLASFKIEE